MSEKEWMASTDPAVMLDHLLGRTQHSHYHGETESRLVSDRKLRLFACACCKENEQNVPDNWEYEGVADAMDWARHWCQHINDTPTMPRRADLLRHIVGNPFRSPLVRQCERRDGYGAKSVSWPSAVLSLAEAVYHQERCGFALYDALTEAGYDDLANHFWYTKSGSESEDEYHPKGCWAIDYITGRE